MLYIISVTIQQRLGSEERDGPLQKHNRCTMGRGIDKGK